MKQTKIMLALVATFILTWMLISFIGYIFSDCTFKECATACPTVMFMLIVGWIPCIFVGDDLNKML